MKRVSKLTFITLFLLAMLITISFAGQAMLSWTAPTTNEDGSVLTDLAGYKVYYGPNQGGPYPFELDVGDVLSVDIQDSTWEGKTICFVATALDASGNESVNSNEVCKAFPMVAPAPPVLTVQ